MAGSEEGLNSLLMKVKELSKKSGLKLNTQKTMIMAPSHALIPSLDPLIHLKGIVTLLQQLGRKAHVHAPTRDEY